MTTTGETSQKRITLEPKISTSEMPKTDALDSAATGIASCSVTIVTVHVQKLQGGNAVTATVFVTDRKPSVTPKYIKEACTALHNSTLLYHLDGTRLLLKYVVLNPNNRFKHTEPRFKTELRVCSKR
jgi:hypothetical protein